MERCALRCVSYPLNHGHQPTCKSGSQWHDSVSPGALRGILDGGIHEHVGSSNQGARLSSLHYARRSNVPEGPFGASGRTKGRDDRSVSPPGGSLRSHCSAASPFVLVLTAEQRVSSTAARRCDVIQQKPIDHEVIFPSLHKTAALL